MPRISVLMPVYNGMPYLPGAVESVLAQDCRDWELLISDDGSTDGTRNYLDTLADPRIRVYRQEKNLGIFGNLNFLLRHANAPIAKIFCQDDELFADALARVAQFMEERPLCAVSRCWAQGDSKVHALGSHYELAARLPARITPAASNLAFATFGNLVGNLSRAACRPQLVLQAGGFDQEYPYAGDYEGWSRVCERFGLDLQNEELLFVRSHATQNSVLLNRKNELYGQINRLIERFSSQVVESDRVLLRRHWTIHFLAPNVSRTARQVMAGEFGPACVPLKDLPLGISAASVIAAYPLWKFNLPPARATTRQLFSRILELNEE